MIDDHVVSFIENAYGNKEFTKDEYDSVAASVRINLIESYGEGYFTEMVYYNYGTEKMMAMANITYK